MKDIGDRLTSGKFPRMFPTYATRELTRAELVVIAVDILLELLLELALFDEVTSALDPETVKEVLQTIRDLANDGITCLLVTHEMGFAKEVGHHIYFTDHGVIVEHGPPETFFKEAKDRRTREFLNQIL